MLLLMGFLVFCEKEKIMVIIRQFDCNDKALETNKWIDSEPFAFHVLMYDILIKGCVRIEVI